jgi:hypothetical protein
MENAPLADCAWTTYAMHTPDSPRQNNIMNWRMAAPER